MLAVVTNLPGWRVASPASDLEKAPDADWPLYPTTLPVLPVMFGPNITGTVTGLDYGSGGWTGGAFNVLKLYPGTTISSESCASQSSFMASRSSSVYGNALTVQPPSLRLIPCIKI